jgi:hypothetical protein
MRRGDGIYLRGNTWWLDFTFKGEGHVARLAKGVNKTVARDPGPGEAGRDPDG